MSAPSSAVATPTVEVDTDTTDVVVEDMVLAELDGDVIVETKVGEPKPVHELPAHLVIYQAVADVGHLVGDRAMSVGFLIGLRKAIRTAVEEEASIPIPPPRGLTESVADANLFSAFHPFVDASYEKDTADAVAKAPMHTSDVLLANWRVGMLKPCYYVAKVDHMKTIMLVVRGTASLRDALTDATAATQPFEGGHVHVGMFTAAHKIRADVRDLMMEQASKYPEYDVVIAGHSLGGGTACLLTMLFVEDIPRVRCVAFAPAAVASPNLCEKYRDRIKCIILQNDLVPRFSVSAAEQLILEVECKEWVTDAKIAASIEAQRAKALLASDRRVQKLIDAAGIGVGAFHALRDSEAVSTVHARLEAAGVTAAAAAAGTAAMAAANTAAQLAVQKGIPAATTMGKALASKIPWGRKSVAEPEAPAAATAAAAMVVTAEAGDAPPPVPVRRTGEQHVCHPPGKLYLLLRASDSVYLKDISIDDLNRIVLSRSMVKDHLMDSYGAALKVVLARLALRSA